MSMMNEAGKAGRRGFAMTASALLLLAAAATPVQAQAPAKTAASDAALEEIVVTGSRLRKTNLSSSVPVTVFDASTIERSGQVNFANVVFQLPFAVQAISATNSAFTTNAAGLANVDLRNLGSARTLVLVDGRRVIAGSPGTSAVDLNSISNEMIERVEVLTGGASAAYGSEAVSGVVNIITKKNFEGIQLKTQYGQSWKSDSKDTTASLTMGSNFANDRGNAAVNITYNDNKGVKSKDRDFSSVDVFNNEDGTFNNPQYSSYGVKGSFLIGGRRYNPDGSTFVTLTDGFNRSPYRTIQVPVERLLVTPKFNYKVDEHLKLFFDATYVNTKSSSDIEPIACCDTTTLGAGPTAPTIAIPVSNPLIPAVLRKLIPSTQTTILFRRRMLDFGDRTTDISRETFRFVTGFNGDRDILGRNVRYDAYYSWGQVKSLNNIGGSLSLPNLQNALNAEVDPAGGYRCADAVARAQGCTPLNVFGPNLATAANRTYILANNNYNDRVSQKVAGGNVTFDLFTLPAGAVGFATGVEHREEDASSVPDPLIVGGLTSGNQAPIVKGNFSVNEGYGEVNIPLLKSMPFVKYLGLEMAGRIADYSTVGQKNSWKLGGEYAVTEDVRFRSAWSTAVRAPNINELYQPASQTFVGANDPCDARRIGNGTNPALRAANCAKIPGWSKTFTQTQNDLQGITGFNSGNPNLDAEAARTLTIGAVLTPRWVEGLSLAADFYRININHAIATFGRQTTVDQCVDNVGFPNNVFCSLVRRDPVTGQIKAIDQKAFNVANELTTGLDFDLNYTFSLDSLGLKNGGDLKLASAASYVIKHKYRPLPTSDLVPEDRIIGNPMWAGNLRIDYSRGPISVAYKARFIGSAAIDLTSLQNPYPGSKTPNYVYHDLQARYEFLTHYEAYVGVTNLFNKQPPFLAQGPATSTTSCQTACDVYDAIGRVVYAGAKVTF